MQWLQTEERFVSMYRADANIHEAVNSVRSGSCDLNGELLRSEAVKLARPQAGNHALSAHASEPTEVAEGSPHPASPGGRSPA